MHELVFLSNVAVVIGAFASAAAVGRFAAGKEGWLRS
jgi:hypothetical protein